VKKFHIPVLDPLIVKEIRAVDGQLDMAGLDIKVEGIKKANLESIRYPEVIATVGDLFESYFQKIRVNQLVTPRSLVEMAKETRKPYTHILDSSLKVETTLIYTASHLLS
jgi:hypothetical protein